MCNIHYKEKLPEKGDLRYEVQPIYKEGYFDSLTKDSEVRTLQYYTGVSWSPLPLFYRPAIYI